MTARKVLALRSDAAGLREFGRLNSGARTNSSDRLVRIGLAMLKESGVKSWRFHRKGVHGHSIPGNGYVYCPYPASSSKLYTLAHECGHVALQHKTSTPRHRGEFEAENYAEELLRCFGVAVPNSQRRRAMLAVAYYIDRDIHFRNMRKIDGEAVGFCRKHLTDATRRALVEGAVVLADLSSRHWKTLLKGGGVRPIGGVAATQTWVRPKSTGQG